MSSFVWTSVKYSHKKTIPDCSHTFQSKRNKEYFSRLRGRIKNFSAIRHISEIPSLSIYVIVPLILFATSLSTDAKIHPVATSSHRIRYNPFDDKNLLTESSDKYKLSPKRGWNTRAQGKILCNVLIMIFIMFTCNSYKTVLYYHEFNLHYGRLETFGYKI